MNKRSFIELFLPDVERFMSLSFWIPESTEDVTCLIMRLICMFAIPFLCWIAYYSIKYSYENKCLRNAIKQLRSNEKPSMNASNHPAFKKYAEACIGFDTRIYYPAAADFFNGDTLAPKLVRNRLLRLVPTIVTGLGVLGTFAGLTVGLDGFDLSGTSDDVNLQIRNMTACASTAFVTSVWGVLASLFLNLVLNWAVRHFNENSRDIQKLTEEKFTVSFPVESFMNDISENLRGSKDALDALAEKIGNSLQESTQAVTSALA